MTSIRREDENIVIIHSPKDALFEVDRQFLRVKADAPIHAYIPAGSLEETVTDESESLRQSYSQSKHESQTMQLLQSNLAIVGDDHEY